MVLTKKFYCLDFRVSHSRNIFHYEIMFSSNLQHTKLKYFLTIRLNLSDPSDDSKTSKFLSYNFSRNNFEKLISNPAEVAI